MSTFSIFKNGTGYSRSSWSSISHTKQLHFSTQVNFNSRRAICVMASATPHFGFHRHSPAPHRVYVSSKAKKAPIDFPDLPSAPRYPCPHLTESETSGYVRPLEAFGWTIEVWDGPRGPKEPSEHVAELMRRFELASREATERFVADAKELVKKENVSTHLCSSEWFVQVSLNVHAKHHPIMTVDNTSVLIRTHTHSAKKGDIKCPGVTLRDIRLAYLLEGRYHDT